MCSVNGRRALLASHWAAVDITSAAARAAAQNQPRHEMVGLMLTADVVCEIIASIGVTTSKCSFVSSSVESFCSDDFKLTAHI